MQLQVHSRIFLLLLVLMEELSGVLFLVHMAGLSGGTKSFLLLAFHVVFSFFLLLSFSSPSARLEVLVGVEW
jgi:hypothetical protein